MKSIKLVVAAFLSLGLFSISTAQAQSFSYSTDFSGANFQSDNTLPVVNNPQTQGNWYNVSDSPNSSLSSFIIGTGGGSNYLSLGGYYLSEPPTSFYTYAQQGINVQSNSVSFNSVFQINPGSTNRIRDSFGWTLFNTTGEQLISVDLNPTGTTQYTLGVTSYSSESSFTSLSFTNNNGIPLTPLNGNTSYELGFNVYNIGSAGARVEAFSYNSGNNLPPTYLGQAAIEGTIWTDVLSNLVGTEIGIIGATWALNGESLADYGNNFMAMNTLSVNSIPEPQTWVLFGIAGLILVVAVRRRVTS